MVRTLVRQVADIPLGSQWRMCLRHVLDTARTLVRQVAEVSPLGDGRVSYRWRRRLGQVADGGLRRV